jgi:protein subunit release factor B
MNKPIFKLTKKDFKIEYLRGSGNGGQHKQKTSSACRITHESSGVSKYCQDHREQHRNKEQAFTKLANDPRFKSWCNIRANEIEMGQTIMEWVDEQMQEKNLLVECF